MAPPRTVLVTGGAGFVGSHLADVLVARGDRVLVLDDLSTGRERNLDSARAAGDVQLVRGSVRDEALVRELVREADEVFHLASVVGVELVLRDPAATIESIVDGSATVLRNAARHQRPVLFTSSSEVYGPRGDGPLREDDRVVLGPPTVARWAYAAAKLTAEHLVLATQTPVVVARLFNVVGPRQSDAYGMVLPRLVRQALAGGPLTVHGDGRQTRSFSDVREVASGLDRLLRCPGARGRVVNVGTPGPIAIGALAELVVRVLGTGAPIVNVPYRKAYGEGYEDVRSREPDVSLLRTLLGTAAARPLEETIRDVAAEAVSRSVPRNDSAHEPRAASGHS